jgi:hypothetical protein
MTLQAVNEWLASEKKEFAAGARIFNGLTKNKNLVRLFTTDHPKPYTREKLLYEMKKLSDLLSAKNKQQAAAAKPKVVKAQPAAKPHVISEKMKAIVSAGHKAVPKPQIMTTTEAANFYIGEWETLPEIVKDWINAIKDKAKHQDGLRHRLEDMTDNDEAEAAAFEILKLDDEIKELREKLRDYKQTGALPEEKPKTSEAELMKKIQRRMNLRTYISRDKPKVEAGTGSKKLPEKVAKWEKELAELDAELG